MEKGEIGPLKRKQAKHCQWQPGLARIVCGQELIMIQHVVEHVVEHMKEQQLHWMIACYSVVAGEPIG